MGVAVLFPQRAAFAATDTTNADLTQQPFLRWATGSGPVDWRQGLALGAIGAFGALVTAYAFFGDGLPGMGGKARVDAMKVELDAAKKNRDASMERRQALLDSG